MSERKGGGENLDDTGQAEVEGRRGATGPSKKAPQAPAAGPHADPALTNPDATPGAGSLPSTSPDDEAAAGTG